MATDEDHNTDLRLKGNLSFIYVASLLIVILIATASAAGLRYRTLVYPTNELVRTFVPNDVVSLSIGLPILIGSMWLARRGRLIGLLCWTGALFFVLYNSIAYVFAVPPGWLFLLQLTLVVLSVYTLIALLTVIDTNVIQQRLTGAVPERLAGASWQDLVCCSFCGWSM